MTSLTYYKRQFKWAFLKVKNWISVKKTLVSCPKNKASCARIYSCFKSQNTVTINCLINHFLFVCLFHVRLSDFCSLFLWSDMPSSGLIMTWHAQSCLWGYSITSIYSFRLTWQSNPGSSICKSSTISLGHNFIKIVCT